MLDEHRVPKQVHLKLKLLSMMAGGEELNKLEVELKEMDRLATS